MGNLSKGTGAYRKKAKCSQKRRAKNWCAAGGARIVAEVRSLQERFRSLKWQNDALRQLEARHAAGLTVAKAREACLTERLSACRHEHKGMVENNIALRQKLDVAERELQFARARERSWEVWWAWFKLNAGPKAAAWAACKGSRRPRESEGRGWGGGQ